MHRAKFLKDMSDEIQKRYFESKGASSLDSLVEEYLEGIRKDLLESLNGFKTASDYLGEEREGLPDDVQPGGIVSDETTVHNVVHDEIYIAVCPVVGKDVRIFMNLCQDFDDLKAWCIGGFCPYYPALNRFPVAPLDVSPKKGTSYLDIDLDKVAGSTLAEKLKNLRDEVVEKCGVQKAREVVKWLVDKFARKKETVKIAGWELEVPGDFYVTAVRGDRKICGKLKQAVLYSDDSMSLLLQDNDDYYLVTSEDVQYIEGRG